LSELAGIAAIILNELDPNGLFPRREDSEKNLSIRTGGDCTLTDDESTERMHRITASRPNL